MSLVERLKLQAKKELRRIVLPEGTEPRTLQAAQILAKEGLCALILLGDRDEIAAKLGSAEGVEIIDPKNSANSDAYAQQLFEIRKNKGMTPEKAQELVRNPLYYGVMMLKMGDAHGLVAGAINSTGDVLRPALQIIKTAPGIPTVSSCMVMEVPNSAYGSSGTILMGDCAVMPNPTAQELAAIAVSTAGTARIVCQIEPKVAMLSFSTKGSAKHELVEKVQEATRIAKEMAPDILLDGELQADAALVSEVGKLKSPDSPVAGQANVLIFPDLQAANIGYKLVERLAGAVAIGPIIQGIAMPVNDLSRGCSVEDIVSVVTITAVQAQASKA